LGPPCSLYINSTTSVTFNPTTFNCCTVSSTDIPVVTKSLITKHNLPAHLCDVCCTLFLNLIFPFLGSHGYHISCPSHGLITVAAFLVFRMDWLACALRFALFFCWVVEGAASFHSTHHAVFGFCRILCFVEAVFSAVLLPV